MRGSQGLILFFVIRIEGLRKGVKARNDGDLLQRNQMPGQMKSVGEAGYSFAVGLFRIARQARSARLTATQRSGHEAGK